MAENAKSKSGSLAMRLLSWLADEVCHNPRLFFYPQVFLFIATVIFTVGPARIDRMFRGEKGSVGTRWTNGIQFDTSRNNLVGAEKKYHKNFMAFKEEFPTQDDLVVVVESESTEKNRQFVERLGAKLEAETNLFTDVFYKGDFVMLGHKALLFVPEDDLKELVKTVREFKPFINQFVQATNLNSLFALINKQFRTAREEQNAENESMVKAMPALERIITQATAAMKRPGTPPSPGISALFGGGQEAEQQVYITFAEGRLFLVTARARDEEHMGASVERLRELVSQTQLEVPGLNVGLTGEPVLEVDEMAQSQFDSTVASVVSLIICALIFIYGYQQTGRPLKAVLSLIIGLGYTMGFTTLVIGHLNILTITFVPILIGLAIDFGVHLITRFEEELRKGHSPLEAIKTAMVFTGMGIFTGAFTTAGAFFAMGGTSFKGIQEMGIICGGGMLLCLVPMMTFLPVMLLRGRQNVIDVRNGTEVVDRRARIESLWLRRPVLVSAITFSLCALAIPQMRKVYFDYNLLHMQSKDLPAVEYEKKLINSAKSVLFAAVIADNPQEAIQLEERIKKLPTVQKVESMVRFLTEDQTKKLALVKEAKRELSNVRFPEIDFRPVDIPELTSTLWSLQGYLGLAIGFTEKEEPEIAKSLASLRNAIIACRVVMLGNDPAARNDPSIPERLKSYQQALFHDIQDTLQSLQQQDDSSGLKAEDLPPALRNRFIGVTGKHLLQVYPKKDVWQRNHQEEFVMELRRELNPKDEGKPVITGTPVQLYEYTTLLKDSYEEAAIYALIAIAILVFIHFRSFTCVLLALLPVVLGTVWLVGFMGAADIPFNPANIMTLPLVIGIGVTNGIHILNRFAEEQNPSILAKSTGKAVLVSGLTTVAGFGSLIVAKHQGIASLGFVMSIGVSTCMIAGLTFLPALLTLLIQRGWTLKKPSDSMHTPSPGSEEPR